MSWPEQIRGVLTIVERVDQMGRALEREREERRHFEDLVSKRLHELEYQTQQLIKDLDVRLTRLEAQRDADRREYEAILARFLLEVERASLKLQLPSPAGSGGSMALGGPDDGPVPQEGN